MTDNFIAVIDGSTSKTARQIKPGINNGRYCMQLISAFIQTMDANISCIEFCQQITQTIQQTYRMVKTEDIHPPKTGISVHFCVLSLMAMQK
ncbi:MAG: hypothetical protein LKE41_00115 [Prevotella sp.]|nr:hypothetical protein [Prevotella sp.]